MNERIPDSSGLPLRAMVMVLLFLGVIFLLVGFQAMSSSGSSDDDASTVPNATATSAQQSPKPVPPKSEVRVYNISGTEGVASRTADKLRNAGYSVADVDNLDLPNVSATTVYFSDAAGEHETADAVGKLLAAPVVPRTSDLASQPPGVIVVVTG
jgi:LytR cell envelope-related transcriptional attenuator